MKVLVTYRTASGNTKKVAEAIYDEIQTDKEIKPWSETKSLEGYDLSFVGFPIEMLGPGPETKKWLAEHVKGKRIAMVITHGSPEEAPPLQEWLQKCRNAAEGAEIVGLFHCQGDMSRQLIDMLIKSDNPQFAEWGKRAQEAPRGFPDAKSLERARDFARFILAKES